MSRSTAPRSSPTACRLPSQHRNLVPKHQQLDILHDIGTCPQHHDTEHRPKDGVHDGEGHSHDHAEPRTGSRTEVLEPHRVDRVRDFYPHRRPSPQSPSPCADPSPTTARSVRGLSDAGKADLLPVIAVSHVSRRPAFMDRLMDTLSTVDSRCT